MLIEMNVLRVEVKQLRATEREARNTEEFLSASVKQLMENTEITGDKKRNASAR